MAIEPIVIRFATAGVPEVTAAFASVSAQVRKFEAGALRESQRGSRARAGGARSETSERERAYAKLVRDVEKFEKQQTREADREAKQREAIAKRATGQTGSAYAKMVREVEKAEQQTTRAVEREEERKMRIRIRSSEMAGRAAAKEAAAEVRAAEQAARARGGAGRRIGGIVSGSVGSLIGGVGSMLGATVGLGGGLMLANAARGQFSAERTAALLVNAGTTGGVAPAGGVGAALRAASDQSIASGMSKEELLGSALKYSQSAKGGDFSGALANMGFFAKMATVTGADINDIAESAGILQSQNKSLQGPGGSAKMQQMLLTTLAGTHEGSASMVDVAKQIGTLGSTRSSFSQDETKSQLSLIGIGQIARRGGDVGEMGTFVKDLSLEAAMANKKWREMKDAHGVKHQTDLITMDKHGQMTSPEQMLGDVLRGTGGNISTINELMGKRGGAVFRELEGSFLEGQKTGGTKGGVAAALAEVSQVTGAAMTPGQFDKQVSTVLETPGAKFKIALNKITDTIEDKLEPRLEHFANDTLPNLIPKFEKIIDEASKFADWFADNPLKGVGAVVLAAISKDLAAAGIGAAVKGIFEAMLKGIGSGGVIPGVGGGGGGGIGKALGTVGAIAGAGALIYGGQQAIEADINTQWDAQGKRMTGILGAASESNTLRKKAAAGTLTATDIAQAQKDAASLGRRQKELQAGPEYSTGESILMGPWGIAGMTGTAKKYREEKEQENTMQLEAATRNLKALNDAILVAAATMPKVTAPAPVVPGAPTQPIPARAVQ